jgi:hypothetical protein
LYTVWGSIVLGMTIEHRYGSIGLFRPDVVVVVVYTVGSQLYTMWRSVMLGMIASVVDRIISLCRRCRGL